MIPSYCFGYCMKCNKYKPLKTGYCNDCEEEYNGLDLPPFMRDLFNFDKEPK